VVIQTLGRGLGKALAVSALAVGTMAVAPGSAHAAVHFYTNNGDFVSGLGSFGYTDENVLFNDGTLSMDGNPVLGKTNMTSTKVKFTGDVNLHPDGGQAKLVALNPPNTTFTDLATMLDLPNTTFKSLSFSINPPQLTGRPFDLGTDTINLFGSNLDLLSTSFGIPSNGLTFFGVIVDGTSSLDKVELTGAVNIDDIRQIRIGGFGVKENENPNPDPVPEPASMALLGLGAAPLLRRLRRSKG
jgi:hypothetical protein